MKKTTHFLLAIFLCYLVVPCDTAAQVIRKISPTGPVCPGTTAVYEFDPQTGGDCRIISWGASITGQLNLPFEEVSWNRHDEPQRIRITWPTSIPDGSVGDVSVLASACCAIVILGCPGPAATRWAGLTERFGNTAGSSIIGNRTPQCDFAGTTSFSIGNPVPGVTYTWSVTGNTGFSAQPVSGQGSTTAVFQVNPSTGASGTSTVVATSICAGRSGTTYTASLSRIFPPSNINGSNTICANSFGSLYTAPEGSNYQWSTVPAGAFTFFQNSGNSVQVTPNFPTASGAILLTYNRPCDNQSVTVSLGIATVNCGGRTAASGEKTQLELIMYPNPVVEELHIENLPTDTEHRIVIYNALGQSVGETRTKKSSISMNAKKWSKGVYVIQIHSSKGMVGQSRVVVTN